MSNNGVRIVLDRGEGRWHWTMTRKREQHVGQRWAETPALAAEKAESYRRQLDLAAHFRKMKAERAKRATPG